MNDPVVFWDLITSFPVGGHKQVRLYISGPIERRNIEQIVSMLQLGLDLGVYGDAPDPSPVTTDDIPPPPSDAGGEDG